MAVSLFFVTNLLNLYRITLFMHKLRSKYSGNKSNEV